MATDYDLRVLLSAEDRISGTLGGVRSALGGLAAPIERASDSLLHFAAVGVRIATVYEVVHQLRSGFDSLTEGIIAFQDRMVQIQSLSGGTAENIRNLGAGLLQISQETGRSATEMGNALFFIESHGYRSADALEILNKAAMLSAAGLGSTDQIVRVVAGQMQAYGASVNETTHYMDVFAKTEQLSALPIGELSGQLQRLTPIAAALRIPVEQVGVAVATISRTGLNASRTMTDLQGVLSQFVKSSPQQQAALEAIGYPIEQLRKDLADPNKNLIGTLTELYKRAEGDVNAFGQIFSDRARALVGFLAVMRNSGKDADDVLKEMANSAGTTAQVFELAQQRISVQLERLRANFIAFGIVATQQGLPDVAKWLRQINDDLQNGDFIGAFDKAVAGFARIPQAIGDMLSDLATRAFGGGVKVAQELANGLIQGANSAINAAVNYVADLIAGFLIGASPPPKGPLHYLREGAQRWTTDYAQYVQQGGQVMQQAAQDVAQRVNEALGDIGNYRSGGGLEAVKAAINSVEDQLLPWKLAADAIKDSYEAQLRPLDRQIEKLQHMKDLVYERQQLEFEQRDIELRQLELQAEGDPVKRARLAGQLVQAQFSQRQHGIQTEEASLQRELRNLRPGRGMSPAEVAGRRTEIQDRLRVLGIERQIEATRNPTLLAQAAQKRELLKYDEAGAKLAHDQWDLNQKMTLQPLIEQRDHLKEQMDAELLVIQQQTDKLEDQLKVLERQRAELEKRKGAGGAGGTPWKIDQPTRPEDIIDAARQKLVDEAANRLTARFQTAISTFMAQRGPVIAEAMVGFIAGGLAGGPVGAVLGGIIVPRLVTAINERGIYPSDFAVFAGKLENSLSTTVTDVFNKLKVGDITGAIGEVVKAGGEWAQAFERGFFAEWYSVTTKGTAAVGANATGGATQQQQQFLEANQVGIITDEITNTRRTDTAEPGSVRRVAPGRAIVERLFGVQDANLNFQKAMELLEVNVFEPVRRAIKISVQKFFSPSQLTEHGQTEYGSSPAQQMIDAIFAWGAEQAAYAEKAIAQFGLALAAKVREQAPIIRQQIATELKAVFAQQQVTDEDISSPTFGQTIVYSSVADTMHKNLVASLGTGIDQVGQDASLDLHITAAIIRRVTAAVESLKSDELGNTLKSFGEWMVDAILALGGDDTKLNDRLGKAALKIGMGIADAGMASADLSKTLFDFGVWMGSKIVEGIITEVARKIFGEKGAKWVQDAANAISTPDSTGTSPGQKALTSAEHAVLPATGLIDFVDVLTDPVKRASVLKSLAVLNRDYPNGMPVLNVPTPTQTPHYYNSLDDPRIMYGQPAGPTPVPGAGTGIPVNTERPPTIGGVEALIGAAPPTSPRPPRDVPSGLEVLFPQWLRDNFSSILEVGKNAVLGLVGGIKDTEIQQKLSDAAKDTANNFIDTTESTGQGHSPWARTEELGKNAILGFNQGIERNQFTTGSIVRTWISTQVIDQARAILQGSGGREPGSSAGSSDGLSAILASAVADMTTYLNSAHGGLDIAAQNLGEEIARNVQRGFNTTPFNLVINGTVRAPTPPPAPRAPASGTESTLPTPEPGKPYAATGADFLVGPRGTDTEYRGMWLTPGERVRVTPAGQVAQGDSTGIAPVQVNYHGPLIHVEHMGGDVGDLDPILDHVRQLLVEDIATARGQGIIRSAGYAPKGTR